MNCRGIPRIIQRIFGTILQSYNDIIKNIGQHKNSIKNKKYFKICKNKKLWNSLMLKIKKY
jgi:hypothetical protein